MVKYYIKLSGLRLLLFVVTVSSSLLTACSSTNNKPLLIGFSADSTSIIFSEIDRPGLLLLKDTKTQDSILYDLISVLQTPSETDTAIKEAPLAGMFRVTDSNIVFKPEQPFLKGRDYLVITYLNARFGRAEQILKSQLNTGIRPYQVLLHR